MRASIVAVVAVALAWSAGAMADQAVPGPGNARALEIATTSPFVRRSMRCLTLQASTIRDRKLRAATLEAIGSRTCVLHRAKLAKADKERIVAKLAAEGLLAPEEAARFPGGAIAGVFPPVLDEDTACPRLPQPFASAPGSGTGGHHAFPGGLAVHEAFNERSSVSFARNYRVAYASHRGATLMDEDLIVAAPIWHDWAKAIVLQWKDDGSEFAEFMFGGRGHGDGLEGRPGDSRTGGHLIIGLAETMKRRLPPAFVITQACAHSAPTDGNEYKVVNWLRAAAIIAQVDPVEAGYLVRAADGSYRLPPLRRTGQLALPASTASFLPEYVIHNLSDADFVLTRPAMAATLAILQALAPRYGFAAPDPHDDPARYNWDYRYRVLAWLTAERIYFRYVNDGLAGVRQEIDRLRARNVLGSSRSGGAEATRGASATQADR